MTLGEQYIVYDIEPDILKIDIESNDITFDIEREYGLPSRYRIQYQSTISNIYVRYRLDKTSISTVLFLPFDIDGMTPSILSSASVTFDIIEHLRYQYTM
jgi:hypothetical protein